MVDPDPFYFPSIVYEQLDDRYGIGGGGGPGTPGSQWFSGVGVPGAGLGIDNDFYMSSVGDVYKKIAGAWVLQFNIATTPDVSAAIDTWIRAGKITGGINTHFDLTDPNTVVVNDITAYSAQPDFLTVTIDPLTSGVTYAVDPLFSDRVVDLENARSLIQTKDALTSGPGNYMSLPGTAGNYISTPNQAAFNFAGDVCFVARIKKPSSTPAANMTIVARYNSLASDAAFRFAMLTTGQLQLVCSMNGTTQSTPFTTPAMTLDGNYIWVKVRRLSSTGDTGFWTAADTGSDNVLPATWTALQLNRTSTAGQLFNNGGALSIPVTVGAYNGGASLPWLGEIGRVIGYSGADEFGTLVFDANAADYTTGGTWVGALDTLTWTINGTASVVLVGGGIVSNSTAEFSLGETDADITIPVLFHDTLMWETVATLTNTSGGAVNFTPKLKVAGVDLFTFTAISIPSAAASVYNIAAAVRLAINASDGTTQIARCQLIVSNAVTGTNQGSIVTSGALTDVAGNRAAAIATITTVPQIQLRMTMGTAASTISARPLLTQLFLASA